MTEQRAFVSFAILFLGAFFYFAFSPGFQSDTSVLVSSARAIYRHLQEGSFRGWTVVHFPISQFIPNLVMIQMGFSDQRILLYFSYMSSLAFLGTLVLLFLMLRKRVNTPAAFLLCFVFLTSYATWYYKVTFNEMMACFWFMFFTFACFRKYNAFIIYVLFVMAGITKEIAPPFLFVLGALALYRFNLLPKKKDIFKWVALGAGAVTTMAIHFCFNIARYGVWYNTDKIHQMTDNPVHLDKWVSHFFGLIVSPNGGLIFLWPAFFVLLLAISWMVVQHAFEKRSKFQIRRILPLLACWGLLFILNAGLAKWWSPFGWGGAWGPRLHIPYLISFMATLCFFYKREMLKITSFFSQSAGLSLFCGALFALLSLPNAIAIVEQARVGEFIFGRVHPQIWPRESLLLKLFHFLDNPRTLNLVTIYFIGITLLAFCVYVCHSKKRKKMKKNQIARACMVFLSAAFLLFAYRAYRFENPTQWFFTMDERSAHSVGKLVRDPRGWFLESSPGESGHILFGPYINLPKGKFRVEYDIRGKGEWGGYDVNMFGENGYILVRARNETGNGQWQTYTAEFTVKDNNKGKFEFRVYSHGRSMVAIREVRLIKVSD